MLTTDRLDTNTEMSQNPSNAPILLRTEPRRWFGQAERVFNPQLAEATLLRPILSRN